ncbi:hypothetical protein BgiBS90_004008, partial [Biomphalaria glabrata]
LVHTMGYSDDLDMIFLLSSAQPLSDSQAQQTYVGFYDNWNGKLLCQFVLERRAFE